MAYKGTYRTESGKNYFSFSYEKQSDGEIRVFIESQPDYQGRETNGHATHRYGVSSDRPHVCYDPPPENLKDAIEISKVWADKTEKYIDTGKKF